MERAMRTDSSRAGNENIPGDYEQEMMPSDVIRQDTDTLTDSTGCLLAFPYPPLEIADYLSHYFPPA